MIQGEFYFDKELDEEISVEAFEDLVAIHGIDKVSDMVEVVTLPNESASA